MPETPPPDIEPQEQAPLANSMKKRLAWVLQAAVSIGLLAWIFADLQMLANMGDTLHDAHLGWLIVGVGCGLLWILSAAYRWQMFLRVQNVHIGVRRLSLIYLVAVGFSLVLPASIGLDAVRILWVMREVKGRKAGILFSVAMEHIAGAVVLMLTAAAIIYWRQDWLAQSLVITSAMHLILLVITATVLGTFLAFVGVRLKWIYTIPQFVPFRRQIIEIGLTFGHFAQHLRLSCAGIAVTFITTWAFFGTFSIAGLALGAQASPMDIFSLMPLIDLISALPVSVSGLGVREKLFETMLETMTGTPANTAVLVSLIGFGFTAIWGVVGALLLLTHRRKPLETAEQPVNEVLPSES